MDNFWGLSAAASTMGPMRVIVTRPVAGGVEHLAVLAPDGATVDELSRRAGHQSPDDGAGVPATPSRQVPLEHGAEIGHLPTGSPVGAEARAGVPRVVVATGPDAGGSAPLPPGRWVTLGRDPRCDLTIADPGLSRRHVRVRQDRDGVRVEDLGSTNGMTWESGREDDTLWSSGDRLLIGGSGIVLVPRPPAPTRLVSRAGCREIVPWPRHTSMVEVREFATPSAPERRKVRAPSAWTWTLPLVVALAVAVLLRMPWLLLFGLLGPAMVLGHHLGDRRAARLEFEDGVAANDAARARHQVEAEVCLREELDLLRHRHPGLVGVVTSLLPHPSVSLWQCAAEPMTVTLGEHACHSQVRLEGELLQHDAAPLSLALDGTVVIAGDRETRDGLARAILLQLATAYPPTSWTLVVDPDVPPGERWDLLAWLPQTDTSGRRTDGVAVRWGQDLVLVDDLASAPPGTTRIQVTGPGLAVLQVPGRPDLAFRPTTLGPGRARSLARALAPLRSREGVREEGGGPALPTGSPPLGALCPWPSTPEEAASRWARPSLAVPLGTDAGGEPVTLDLVRDGPHALVAGTTGSGKSELLRTLITGLALQSSPADLALLLVDFKGGSSLGDCARLPHVTGLVTDLDPHLAARVLTSLQAELTRREATLADAGAKDARDLPGLPRLVVVIDEFRVLAEEVPEVMSGLVRLAAVGRSLGVHLVLATQRPAGVVSADLRANVNLRIALRVRDSADSQDVIETPAASLLPQGRPGLALWRTGAEAPQALQVARAGPPLAGAAGAWEVRVTGDVWAARRILDQPAEADEPQDDLGPLADVLTRAAAEKALEPPVVWHPPLPDSLPPLADSPAAWALADLPAQQRRQPLVWGADEHLAVLGSARSGRTTALRSVLSRVAGAWVVVLDLGRALEGTEAQSHPGLVAWVEPDDLAHGLRVLDRLEELVRSRQATGTTGPPVLLVVDGWDRFVDLFETVERGRAEEVALRLLREGPAVGVVGLVTGDRTLLFGKIASLLPRTWALRLNDPADLLMTGLRASQIPTAQPPGRLVGMRDGIEAHVVLPAHPSPAGAPPGPPPLVCRPLPRVWAPEAAQEGAGWPDAALEDEGPGAGHQTARPVGGDAAARPVGGDEAAPMADASQEGEVPDLGRGAAWAVGGDEAAPMQRPAGSILVLGPPGSGRTTALQWLRAGRDAVVVDPAEDHRLEDLEEECARLGPGGLLVVDDAHLLSGNPLEEAVAQLATAYRMELLVAADLDAGTAFRGLIPLAARGRTGLVLNPHSPSDGGVLGVSLPVGDLAIPGRGLLVHRGRCTRVQVAAPPRRDSRPVGHLSASSRGLKDDEPDESRPGVATTGRPSVSAPRAAP